MAVEQPSKDSEVTPKGAVEVNEEDLDQAAGGTGAGGGAGSLSLNYGKMEPLGQKPPQDNIIVAAGPGAGPHVIPVPDDNKKI